MKFPEILQPDCHFAWIGQRFVTLDQVRQAIEQAMLALDSCLPYSLDVQDA